MIGVCFCNQVVLRLSLPLISRCMLRAALDLLVVQELLQCSWDQTLLLSLKEVNNAISHLNHGPKILIWYRNTSLLKCTMLSI